MKPDLHKLYIGCRSYRRFRQESVPQEVLQEIADTARMRSCALNRQALRYLVISSPDMVKKLHPCFRWAAKLPKEIGTPTEAQRPTAYIVLLKPEKAHAFADIDAGIALDAMAITAWSHGVGSCILGSVNRKILSEAVKIPAGFDVQIVLALGYPDHKSTIVEAGTDDSLSYYVDEHRDYYVPKKSAAETITYL
ncbi:nitroreductase family protein [Selenomonas sp. TAMA-11512]|uniref:nitroreductase family protein n=1 Tax=Selenomonas sp. TAMA-11512 TaxID=3095337 RepID=UPI0030855138|nr:nitroreductase family protein [Selenomonas sp. TAMA-11512]